MTPAGPKPVSLRVPRRTALLAFAVAAGGLVTPIPSKGADRPAIEADFERAVTSGLNFLARQQAHDGSFDAESSDTITTTARALLAFLAAGNAPDIGRHGLTVQRAVEWLLGRQTPEGTYGPTDHGLRAHIAAATALAEAYGVETTAERRANLYASLSKSAAAILGQQVPEKLPTQPGGGWAPADTRIGSLTISALTLLALRAGADIGIATPPAVTTRAVSFVLRCYDTAAGAFGPVPGQRPDLRSACAGVVALHACDAWEQHADQVSSTTKFILAHANQTPDSGGGIVPLAALKLGPDVWNAVAKPRLDRLTRAQEKDGGWKASTRTASTPISRTAATASALAALTMSYPLLPIYQR